MVSASGFYFWRSVWVLGYWEISQIQRKLRILVSGFDLYWIPLSLTLFYHFVNQARTFADHLHTQSTRFLKIKGELLQSVFYFHRLVAGKKWEKSKCTLVSIRFFLYWFLFSNRTVKKDRSFIVFWDQIMFLGLFIFAVESDYVFGFVYICWGFHFSALLIKIYFDLSLIL